MHRDMALVQVSHRGISRRNHAVLRNENGHGASLRLVILAGYIQYGSADHIRHIGENLGQTLGIILFINISDIVLLFPLGLCIADIIYIEAQRFC